MLIDNGALKTNADRGSLAVCDAAPEHPYAASHFASLDLKRAATDPVPVGLAVDEANILFFFCFGFRWECVGLARISVWVGVVVGLGASVGVVGEYGFGVGGSGWVPGGVVRVLR